MKPILIAFLTVLLAACTGEDGLKTEADVAAPAGGAFAGAIGANGDPFIAATNPDQLYALTVIPDTSQHQGDQEILASNLGEQFLIPLQEIVEGTSIASYFAIRGEVASSVDPLLEGQYKLLQGGRVIAQSGQLVLLAKSDIRSNLTAHISGGVFRFTPQIKGGSSDFRVELHLRDNARNAELTLGRSFRVVSKEEAKAQLLKSTFTDSAQSDAARYQLLVSHDANFLQQLLVPRERSTLEEVLHTGQPAAISRGNSLAIGVLLQSPKVNYNDEVRLKVNYQLYDPRGNEVARISYADLYSSNEPSEESMAFLAPQIMKIQTDNRFQPGSYLVIAEIIDLGGGFTQKLGKRIELR